jgi:hypothetical protein
MHFHLPSLPPPITLASAICAHCHLFLAARGKSFVAPNIALYTGAFLVARFQNGENRGEVEYD